MAFVEIRPTGLTRKQYTYLTYWDGALQTMPFILEYVSASAYRPATGTSPGAFRMLAHIPSPRRASHRNINPNTMLIGEMCMKQRDLYHIVF